MGSINVFAAPTWWDFYRNEEDITRLQQAVTPSLTTAVDWDDLLAQDHDGINFSLSYLQGAYFSSILAFWLDEDATSTRRIDLLPLPLNTPVVDMSQTGRSWRIYSANRILTQWDATVSVQEQEDLERLADENDDKPFLHITASEEKAVHATYLMPLGACLASLRHLSRSWRRPFRLNSRI